MIYRSWDKENDPRISKANQTLGQLYTRVSNPHNVHIFTKLDMDSLLSYMDMSPDAVDEHLCLVTNRMVNWRPETDLKVVMQVQQRSCHQKLIEYYEQQHRIAPTIIVIMDFECPYFLDTVFPDTECRATSVFIDELQKICLL